MDVDSWVNGGVLVRGFGFAVGRVSLVGSLVVVVVLMFGVRCFAFAFGFSSGCFGFCGFLFLFFLLFFVFGVAVMVTSHFLLSLCALFKFRGTIRRAAEGRGVECCVSRLLGIHRIIFRAGFIHNVARVAHSERSGDSQLNVLACRISLQRLKR